MRLLMYVGQCSDHLRTIAEVAGVHAISEAHLTKVTHKLGLGSWLETMRGKGGGIRLALSPERINVGAVVRSVEPDFFLVECLIGDEGCILTGNCRLVGVVNGAQQSFLKHFDQFTLVDLMATSPQPVRMVQAKSSTRRRAAVRQ